MKVGTLSCKCVFDMKKEVYTSECNYHKNKRKQREDGNSKN